MARVLIIGCGCRGRALTRKLRREGYLVRGTTRDHRGEAAIEAAGADSALADPDRLETVFGALDGVAVVAWLLGSATGGQDAVAALHGARLETLLHKVVDTPVRGFIYEAGGTLPERTLKHGRGLVEAAARTWSLPAEIVEADPQDHEVWLASVWAAVSRLTRPALP